MQYTLRKGFEVLRRLNVFEDLSQEEIYGFVKEWENHYSREDSVVVTALRLYCDVLPFYRINSEPILCSLARSEQMMEKLEKTNIDKRLELLLKNA